MHVEQAIFASTNRGRIKGYQVLSASPGVDQLLHRELARWAPTQMPDATSGRWAVSSFPVSDQWVGISRSVSACPEYSDRGGMNIVTRFLLLTPEQFAVYDCNAIALARMAMALGCLRLPIDLNPSPLPQVELPERPFVPRQIGPSERSCNTVVRQALACFRDSKRVVVINCEQPFRVLEAMIPQMPKQRSRDFSFTTGLLPSVRRPFKLHFLADINAALERMLAAQNIVAIKL